MQTEESNVGQKGRFYLTKNIWVPQEPIENFNLRMSDMILRRMPKLPLGGEDAIRQFPMLTELRKSHDKIKADLEYLLSHHEEIPALHEVHPRDLYVPGRAWRTFLLKIWGHEVKENTAAVPDTYEAICRIPGVQGVSMVPVLKGNTPADWRKEHYYHYYEYPGPHMVRRHYGISTERYKLIHFYYDIDEWELFDFKTDPLELKNVYNDPAYSAVRKDLHKRLSGLMKKYGDSDALARSFLPGH